jgi:drug/metabolite transporter (DMT)-like permease
MGPSAIGFWRTLFGGGALFLVAAISHRRLILSRSLVPWSILAGFIFFSDLFFWHRSIIMIGAGLATILVMTQVFVTAILGRWVFGERLRLSFFLSALAAVGGVTLLIGVGSEIKFSSEYLWGAGLGLLTGVSYGSYLVTLKKMGHRAVPPDFIVFMAWTSIFTTAFLLVAALLEEGPMVPPDLYSWIVLVALGVVVQALGWWFVTRSLPRLEASRGSLVMVLQPVLTTVWGYLLFSEHLTWLQLLGASITLTAVYYGSVHKAHSRP